MFHWPSRHWQSFWPLHYLCCFSFTVTHDCSGQKFSPLLPILFLLKSIWWRVEFTLTAVANHPAPCSPMWLLHKTILKRVVVFPMNASLNHSDPSSPMSLWVKSISWRCENTWLSIQKGHCQLLVIRCVWMRSWPPAVGALITRFRAQGWLTCPNAYNSIPPWTPHISASLVNLKLMGVSGYLKYIGQQL